MAQQAGGLKFLLDNNLPPALAEALHALSKDDGHTVVHLRSRFSERAPDHEWIAELANEGDWVVVSHDRFAKNELERKALQASGLIVFVLTRSWSKLRFWDKAILLVRWRPRILEQAGLVETGGFLVPPKYGAKGRFKSVPL